MIPVVLISGYTDSGKTTVIQRLLEIYAGMGYDVATVKHHKGNFDIGENKDSGKHLKAGASSVSLSSDEEYIIIKKAKRDDKLQQIIDDISGVDMILVEGYKNENFPKIEIYRGELGNPRLKDENVIGIVSDDLCEEKENVPVFRTDQIGMLSEFIKEKFKIER